MKRIVPFFLAMILAFSLAACGGNAPAATEATQQTTEATQPAETETAAPETSGSPSQMVLAEFRDKVSNEGTMEELADAIVTSEWVPFAGAVMTVEPGYLNGFSSEITGFAEGAMFGPMIGSIPCIGYVFRLENAADAEAFMKTLRENADLRWNICTQADEMICEASDNIVLFAMTPAAFDD